MYERYWQLDCNPFANDSHPQAYYQSASHQSALLKLRYLIENRKGAGLLAGAHGLGKTYLTRILARQLDDASGPCVHVVYPRMAAHELLAWLAVELGADRQSVGSETGGLDRTLHSIERLLTAYGEQDRHPVILVDEADLIDDVEVFQALRLLLNFHRNQRPQFSLIFIGRPELLPIVGRIRALDERLEVRCLLQPLSAEEIADYVSCRLAAAGANRMLFDDSAWEALYELSAGVPRRINHLCDMALLVGFSEESSIVSAAHLEAVADELMLAAA
ncbi:MAG: AAA family ATPase [Planctomycetaceae bacterium]|nr:AAA family ATPase [Planctomycetaceae bacterium]